MPWNPYGIRRGACTWATGSSDALRAGLQRGHFIDVGLAYVQFAVDHPAHFEVTWWPDLYRAGDPEIAAARKAAVALFQAPPS